MLNSQFDVSLYQTKSSYADMCEEFFWFPLNSYIEHVGGSLTDLNTFDKKVRFVTEVCEQELVFDNGVAGVNSKLYSDGRKKVRVGTKTSVDLKQDLFSVLFWQVWISWRCGYTDTESGTAVC